MSEVVDRRPVPSGQSVEPPMTRDQRRSLMLGQAVADKLLQDPQVVLDRARINLSKMQGVHTRGQSKMWLEHWERILQGSPFDVASVLTSSAPFARELRQNTPFAGVLSESERLAVLQEFKTQETTGLSLV